ncbi:MAG: hypothetical protein JRI68_07460 [Deltaproteobacteria bacterium]|nr:hypothetical protein [Deltaproteobacteria bacterium]
MVWGAVALVACGSDFTSGSGGGGAAPGGSGGTSTSSGSGGSATSTGTGGGGECPPDTIPVPPFPEAWSGPAKIAPAGGSDPLPGCDGLEAWTLHSGIDFDDAICACVCGSPVCQATIGYYANDNNCQGTPAATDAAPVGCTNVNPSGAVAKWWASPTCAPNGTEELPEVGWESHLQACALFSEGAEESCAPAPAAPFSTVLCVVREGDGHNCPAGYEDRLVLYSDSHDTRGCTPDCTCSADYVQCGDALHVYSDPNCGNGGTMGAWAEDNCITSLTFNSVSYVATTTVGTCTKASVEATGTVTPTNPFTVCCTPK